MIFRKSLNGFIRPNIIAMALVVIATGPLCMNGLLADEAKPKPAPKTEAKAAASSATKPEAAPTPKPAAPKETKPAAAKETAQKVVTEAVPDTKSTKLKFQFRFQPWLDVLQWLARAGRPFVGSRRAATWIV